MGIPPPPPLLRTRLPAIVIIAAWALLFQAPLASGQETDPEKIDCRYWTKGSPQGEVAPGKEKAGWFPEDNLFRPIFADPKQPMSFLTDQRVRFRDLGQSINAAFVAVGGNFGLWTTRHETCNGWQISLQGAVFAQFNLDGPSKDLINADYVIGIPVTWRRGPVSVRTRLYHQSSHLGDEFLINNPSFLSRRLNYSFEEVESILSWDYSWLRLYGGGGYLVHRYPDLKRGKLEWGFEARRPDRPSPVFRNVIKDLLMIPMIGTNVQNFEQLNWTFNVSTVGGVEFARPGSSRRLRFLLNYYHGYNPYGQFFSQKVEYYGGGVYLTF